MPQRISFFNSLGQVLAGLVHRRNGDGEPLGSTVVLCHGMMSSKEGRKQALLAEALGDEGLSVLRFDFSFCGESGGKFEEITFTQEVDDLACAVRWAREQGAGPVGLLGSSMGGSVALLYGGGDADLGAVVTLAALAHPGVLLHRADLLRDIMQSWREEGYHFGAEGDVGKCFFEDASGQDISGAVRSLKAPVLILHGARDEIVPVADAHTLHDHARSQKKLKIYPGADHRFLREEDLQDVVSETCGWFRKHLLSGCPSGGES